MSIAERDRPLIEALIAEENTLSPKKRHICNGRFLTMHKRRRKKLQTRSLAFEPAVLDDILHGQVTCILKQAGNWRFNAFSLETVTGGKVTSLSIIQAPFKRLNSLSPSLPILHPHEQDDRCLFYVFTCFICTAFWTISI
jgi:hypothetical protein